jgi:hypothetical protein
MPMTGGTNPSELVSSNVTRITGGDEAYAADVVERPDGKKSLCVCTGGNVITNVATLDKKFRLFAQDINLALTTNYQTVITYTGAALLLGWVVDTTSNLTINFEFTIDGETVFTELSSELISNFYGTNYGADIYLYFGRSDFGDFQFRPPLPIKVNSNFTVRARRTTGTARTVNRIKYIVNGV